MTVPTITDEQVAKVNSPEFITIVNDPIQFNAAIKAQAEIQPALGGLFHGLALSELPKEVALGLAFLMVTKLYEDALRDTPDVG